MKLTEATAVIRPRRGWEAIDLGIRMVQRDFRPLARRWVIATLPWFVLTVTIGDLLGDVGYGILMFWWLKPAFDRVPLDYLSKRLFSERVEDPGPFDLWFRLPFSADAWRQLTYLRFSLVRTFSLPVYQLEGASKGRGERIRTLVARDYGASAWLTIVFHVLSSLLLVVIIAQIASWLHPSPIVLQDADIWDTLLNTQAIFTGALFWLHLILFYVITGIFELFFVGAGFAMYLNRRTHLEAWDIELSFRRLAQRLSRGAAIAMLATCLFVPTWLTTPTHAQATTETAVSDDAGAGFRLPAAQEARMVASDIYAGDEFGEHITGRAWRAKATDDEESTASSNLDVLQQVGPFVTLLANLLKYLVILVVVLLLGLWLIRERKRLMRLKRAAATPRQQTTVEEVEGPREFVPDANVPEVVSRLWADGKPRESLSYLYRSALSYLTSRHKLIIGDHATEEDCLRLVRDNASESVSSYFSDITRQWRLLAYGNRRPADETIADLCSRWPQLAPAARPTTGATPDA